jgi:anaerobic ribonucleoside-triphosphate reductase activating protein
MRYSAIRSCDINNGSGLRITLWTQGCRFFCKNCHNQHLWDFNSGKEFTEETINKIIKLLNSPQNLSILGGEPLVEENIEMLTKLVKKVKEVYPNKNIWVWTGNLFENVKELDLIKYIDILIDGQFKEELYNKNLKWRGSSNQRIINVQESLKGNEIVLY